MRINAAKRDAAGGNRKLMTVPATGGPPTLVNDLEVFGGPESP